MLNRFKALASFLMIVSILMACSPAADQAGTVSQVGQRVAAGSGSYTDISPEELALMLAEKDFPLVNVHIPYEGDLPGTDVSIPFDQIRDYLGELPEDRDAKIVLYCRSDSMSTTAARELVSLGYTNVYNLDGGFMAWQAAGFEFIAP